MRNFCSVICLVLTANVAMAGWEKIGEEGIYSSYVDSVAIQKNSSFAKMWQLVDAKTAKTTTDGKKYLSVKTQSEYNCDRAQYRLLGFSLYSANMGEGEVVVSKSGNGKWMPVPADRNTLWRIACGVK